MASTKVRDYINAYGKKFGITNDDIGWDNNTKTVLLGGQELIKPDSIVDGRSYVNDVDVLKSAINSYAQNMGLTDRYDPPEFNPVEAGIENFEYESPYSSKIDNILDSILNTKEFSYNVNEDPTYQAMQQTYEQSGKKAMNDTLGAVSSMTGGIPSTYATTAANSAYNDHMQQLNAQIPNLYETAYNMYLNDITSKQNNLSTLVGLDETAYNRSKDQYMDEYNRYLDEYSAETDSFDQRYKAFQDDQAQANWEKSYDFDVDSKEQSQANWEQTFDYNKQQDEQNQANWEETFKYNKQQDNISNSIRWSQLNTGSSEEEAEDVGITDEQQGWVYKLKEGWLDDMESPYKRYDFVMKLNPAWQERLGEAGVRQLLDEINTEIAAYEEPEPEPEPEPEAPTITYSDLPSLIENFEKVNPPEVNDDVGKLVDPNEVIDYAIYLSQSGSDDFTVQSFVKHYRDSFSDEDWEHVRRQLGL